MVSQARILVGSVAHGEEAPVRPKPLIIGQAPARGNDGLPPFSGQSGARLARLAGVGDTGDVLPDHFQMMNLVDHYPGKTRGGRGDLFPTDLAQAKANRLLAKLYSGKVRPRTILMMGAKVTDIMGFPDLPNLGGRYEGGHHWIRFPHPSGASPYWNDPTCAKIAGWILKGALRDGG